LIGIGVSKGLFDKVTYYPEREVAREVENG
jgi:hypothetical protein